ncbi:zinc finger protein 79-like [Cydia strobilella]|uniref:zinc finger protein 79-like n=1 Tax=Cydia strobilella TaxID=1100964 RepID=UPI003003FDF9
MPGTYISGNSGKAGVPLRGVRRAVPQRGGVDATRPLRLRPTCQVHIYQVTVVKPESRCAGCGAQFHSAEALTRHAPCACDPHARPCLVCGETLSTDEELQAHAKERHSTDQFKCVQCDKTFASSKSYEVHHQRVHLNVRWRKSRDKRARRTHSDPPKRKEAMCEVCGKACESNAALVYHQRSHTGERPYKCTQCPKSFTMPQALIVSTLYLYHQRSHTGERPYKCTQCPKSFTMPQALIVNTLYCIVTICKTLVYHQRSHTGERPYKCTQCPKSFTMPQALINHQLVHSDERPYTCSVCPKAFKQKVALQLHSRVHTGERPYKCSLCDSSFKQGPHLRTHVKLMHHAPDRRPRRKL